MGALTECEIFDRMATSFATAADLCDVIARSPLKGAAYDRLRRELQLIEGCCKQAATWREDSRWLPIGMMMAECHKRAGDWLRGIKLDDGRRIKIADGTLHPCFVMLANNLRALKNVAEQMKTGKTGRKGIILPETQRAPTRTQGRPVSVLLPHMPPANVPKLILTDSMGQH